VKKWTGPSIEFRHCHTNSFHPSILSNFSLDYGGALFFIQVSCPLSVRTILLILCVAAMLSLRHTPHPT